MRLDNVGPSRPCRLNGRAYPLRLGILGSLGDVRRGAHVPEVDVLLEGHPLETIRPSLDGDGHLLQVGGERVGGALCGGDEVEALVADPFDDRVGSVHEGLELRGYAEVVDRGREQQDVGRDDLLVECRHVVLEHAGTTVALARLAVDAAVDVRLEGVDDLDLVPGGLRTLRELLGELRGVSVALPAEHDQNLHGTSFPWQRFSVTTILRHAWGCDAGGCFNLPIRAVEGGFRMSTNGLD